jgi:hypothetical protein
VDKFDRLAAARHFGPDRRLTAAYSGAVVVALGATALTADAAGRILFGIAAIILAGYAATDLVYSPRLVASADGLTIHTPTLTGQFPWSAVHAVRADSRQRAGLRLVTLEIDVADSLAVFSRRALGTDPETAARQIRLVRPPGC